MDCVNNYEQNKNCITYLIKFRSNFAYHQTPLKIFDSTLDIFQNYYTDDKIMVVSVNFKALKI